MCNYFHLCFSGISRQVQGLGDALVRRQCRAGVQEGGRRTPAAPVEVLYGARGAPCGGAKPNIKRKVRIKICKSQTVAILGAKPRC